MLGRVLKANFSLVRLSRWDSGKYNKVCKLQLNHPEKRNAMSIELLKDLDSSLKQINATCQLRAVVVMASQEGQFCAGANLKERIGKSADELDLLVANLRRILNDLRYVHCPVISLLDGPALGGGLELALNTDIRISTERALIGLPETHWSLIPGGGGTQTLARQIGLAKAKQLIFTGRKIDGATALSFGIVNYHVADLAHAKAKALSLIDQMFLNAPIAIEHAKKSINWGYETDLRTGLEIQRLNYQRVLRTKDREEGFKSFAEKRQPNYKGQ